MGPFICRKPSQSSFFSQNSYTNSPGHRPQGVLRSTIIGLSDFFDNWGRLVGRQAGNERPAQHPETPGRTKDVPGTIFTDFSTPQSGIEKSKIFRILKKLPKWENKSNRGRSRDHFSSKSLTFGLPFGIDFSTFFKNGESVKSAAGRSCSAERALGVFR